MVSGQGKNTVPFKSRESELLFASRGELLLHRIIRDVVNVWLTWFSCILFGLEAFSAAEPNRMGGDSVLFVVFDNKKDQQLQDRRTQLCVIIFPTELWGFFAIAAVLLVCRSVWLFLLLLRQNGWQFFDSKFATFPLANSAELQLGR